MIFKKLSNCVAITLLSSMVLMSGCSQVDVSGAVANLPQVKSYMENNPDFELNVVYFSEDEVKGLSNEFKANCGKDIVLKPIYRFVVDDKKSISGIGYFDLNNQVLECFKKRTGDVVDVQGENVAEKAVVDSSILVDNVLVGSDGNVKVGNSVVVSDGFVKVGGIEVSSDNVVKINEDIVVSEDGNVKVGDILISDNGVSVDKLKVDADGNLDMSELEKELEDMNKELAKLGDEFKNDMNDLGKELEEDLNNSGVSIDSEGVEAPGVSIDSEGIEASGVSVDSDGVEAPGVSIDY